MSHEITACRRKWQLMKNPRSRSHRQRELGSEILNTKSHFWFGSWWNSEPNSQNARAQCPKSRTGCDKTDDKQLFEAWKACPGSEEGRWVQRLGWRTIMMMSRCSAAAKMDWPKLGLIKSQGWLCSSADIINIKMIMVEQFGSDEPDQFTPAVWCWNTHICILTELSSISIHKLYNWKIKEFIWDPLLLWLNFVRNFEFATTATLHDSV